MRRIFYVQCGLCLLAQALFAQIQVSSLLTQAKYFLEGNDFAAAAQRFELLISDPSRLSPAEHEEVLLGIAKANIGLVQFDRAEAYFSRYATQFPAGAFIEEVLYRRARIPFQRGSYPESIATLTGFLETYPNSKYEANVYYWTAESLLQLGRIEEAENLFLRVVNEFSTSYRVEAAQYRLEVIALEKNERELRRLLKASNEKLIELSDRVNHLEKELMAMFSGFEGDFASMKYITENDTESNDTESEDAAARRRYVEELEKRIEKLAEEMSQLFSEIEDLKE